jgi:hypothetical protein
MDKRKILIFFAITLFFASVWLVASQRQQLAALRAEQQRPGPQILNAPEGSQLEIGGDNPSRVVTDIHSAEGGPVSSELLQLRSEVTRLSTRLRELAVVTQENSRLHGQLERSSTNSSTGPRLPPGYVRKSSARLVGYKTPEDTIQSFLWALQTHDLSNVINALTPAAGEDLQQKLQQQKSEDFFKATDALPGLGIQGKSELPDGTLELQIEIAPGVTADKFRLQQVNGEWKLNVPF